MFYCKREALVKSPNFEFTSEKFWYEQRLKPFEALELPSYKSHEDFIKASMSFMSPEITVSLQSLVCVNELAMGELSDYNLRSPVGTVDWSYSDPL